MNKTPRTDAIDAEYRAGWQQKYDAMKNLAVELEIELGKVLGRIPANYSGEEEEEE
jgi:hypothetical protein